MPTDEDLEEWISGETMPLNFDGDSHTDASSIDSDVKIVKIIKRAKKGFGCVCTKCGELYEYAEPNRDDGTFKCWGCRH